MRRLFIAWIVFVSSSVVAADWPQWRGPTRDGVAEDAALPSALPAELKPIWRVEVGEGHSGPVVAGGRVALMARQGGEEAVLCFDADTGQPLWRDAYPAPYKPVPVARGHKQGPFATPAIAGGKVYTHGITGVLSCYAFDSGKRLWRRRFGEEFVKTWPLYGHSCSPLIEGKLCIVAIGADNDGALAAFDKDTGKDAWRYSDDGPSYCSGIAADLAGKRQLVTFTQKQLVGVDPADGRLLWRIPHETQYVMNIPTPAIDGDVVFYTGFRTPLCAARIVKQGAGFAAKPLWSNRGFSSYMNSPVLRDGYLYGLRMKGGRRGALGCVDVRTGKVAWESPRMDYYASIVRAGDRLLVTVIDGTLRMVEASPAGYRELSRTRLSQEPVWAHPALVGTRLFVKDRTALMCFDLGKE